jgi:hypothetical protein
VIIIAIDISNVLEDPDLGSTDFTVERTVYRRRNGESIPTTQMLTAVGCIHPGTPEMVQLLPEEEKEETFIAVYTGFSLSTGENSGGATYRVPDRIHWGDQVWRVVRVKSWMQFGYVQALAVLMHEGDDT